jgi:ArsR family metal-binding transcriptional regulator
MSPDDSLMRAEELLDRLESSRAKLEQTKDPDEAIAILGELAEIAKEVEAELARAKKEADAAG